MVAEILLIEDYGAHRALLDSIVTNMGCRPIQAPDGASGLELAALRQPALIVLDMILPDLDGRQVLRRLRQSDECRNTPVLIVSAVEEHDAIIEALAAGADDYLTKPVDPLVLEARIRVLLRAARRPTEPRAAATAPRGFAPHPAPGLVEQEIRRIKHEINNPLACIVGLTQLLQLRLKDQPDHQRHLQSILDSTERITELLDELRDFATTLGEGTGRPTLAEDALLG